MDLFIFTTLKIYKRILEELKVQHQIRNTQLGKFLFIQNSVAVVTFADLEEAFDRVNHGTLWRSLSRRA